MATTEGNNTHPVNPDNGRFICSPENPMPEGAKGRWEHDGEEYDSCMDGCCALMKCKNCNLKWREELPQ